MCAKVTMYTYYILKPTRAIFTKKKNAAKAHLRVIDIAEAISIFVM